VPEVTDGVNATRDPDVGRKRGRARAFFAAHRRLVAAILALGAALLVFATLWFQPYKLFIDETVDEAIPAARAGGTDEFSSDESASTSKSENEAKDGRQGEAAEPRVLASGMFRSLEHSTSGRAAILELADGRRFLRFEDLDTSNGPDLRVYLSEIPASDDWYAYGERFVDLGALKGNEGDQNYLIPADLGLARFKSAVIWCRRFTVGFGVAPL
jgi:Electron transfer DM13